MPYYTKKKKSDKPKKRQPNRQTLIKKLDEVFSKLGYDCDTEKDLINKLK